MPWTSAPPPSDPPSPLPPRREPLFNAPLAPLALAVSMPVLFLAQLQAADGGFGWAFRPSDLAEGRWETLFTAMLLHGGWAHVAMNAVFALAFGAPLARMMRGGRGLVAFMLFYIGAGLVASLGYGLVHWGDTTPMVGASGAVFGLLGGAIRLMFGRGAPAALTDRRVVSASLAIMGINLATGLLGLAPGVEPGVGVAWEAHAFGFAAGLIAVGPLARLFPASAVRFDSSDDPGDPVP